MALYLRIAGRRQGGTTPLQPFRHNFVRGARPRFVGGDLVQRRTPQRLDNASDHSCTRSFCRYDVNSSAPPNCVWLRTRHSYDAVGNWCVQRHASSIFPHHCDGMRDGNLASFEGCGLTTAPNNSQKAQAIARCAANVGNSLSLAALLPSGAPTFLQNALGNDFSTISNLITGPGRGGAAISIAQGKLTSTAVTAVGNIPTGSSLLFIEGEGAAQNTIEVTPTVATSLLGEAAGALITSVAEAKVAFDAATYLYGVLKCSNVVP